jgi:hypothetical protein
MKILHGAATEEISKMYHYDQLTMEQIGKIYNVSESTIYRFFKKNNIRIRSKSEAINICKLYRKKTQKIVKSKIKNILKCSNCVYIFKNELKNSILVKCPKCDYLIDSRFRKPHKDDEGLKKLKIYKKKNYDKLKIRSKEYRWKFRLSVLTIVGRGVIKCVNCGCTNPRFIEINHKNGGGIKDIRPDPMKFYYSIKKLERHIDDLELTCRICNTLHYMELLHGKLPYKIIWNEKHG